MPGGTAAPSESAPPPLGVEAVPVGGPEIGLLILSDGEPTSGAIIDPHRIRETVAFWNRHRGIKIHTIAIGGNLEVLEWLSEDSGGDHVRIR